MVRLFWKLTSGLTTPWETYLVSILNLVNALVTLYNRWSCEVVGGKEPDILRYYLLFRWRPICINGHLYQNVKSVPFVPKLFNSISDWSNCEPTNYCIYFLLFKQKKTKQQNSDRRSRANVLRACQQRVGLYTKIRAGYPPATFNQELKVVGFIVLGQLNIFGTNGIDFLFWYKWDWFIILVLVNNPPLFNM